MQSALDSIDALPDQISPLASAPTRNQVRLGLGLCAGLIVALLLTLPHARHSTHGTEPLLPAYATAVFLVELLTSTLLLAIFYVRRSRAILLLAIAYLFSAALVVPWALTFPGVLDQFMSESLMQSTAWIAAVRRLSFPLLVIAYAVLANHTFAPGSEGKIILGSVLGVTGAVGLATWFVVAHDHALPKFMLDARNVSNMWRFVPAASVMLYLIGLTALGRRRSSMLDVWLMVVLFTMLIEILLLSYASGGIRLSVGWWAGRIFGLASTGTVLLVLLSEATTVHARLARAVRAEHRARQSRLTAMEALSASIAHEVNQPITTMVTNASAGLKWLAHEPPHLGEARAALERIVIEGHRASKVVVGLRTMFIKGAQEREPLDLNRLINATLAQRREELRLGRVSMSTDLEADLPQVVGNAAQLTHTIANLIDNAVDSVRSAPRPRILHIASRRHEFGEVLVSVADTGSGLAAVDRERIFDPFFTTKQEGMGMGLMFCRTMVEAHGGRLWASDNEPRGAIFQFWLPASGSENKSSEQIS